MGGYLTALVYSAAITRCHWLCGLYSRNLDFPTDWEVQSQGAGTLGFILRLLLLACRQLWAFSSLSLSLPPLERETENFLVSLLVRVLISIWVPSLMTSSNPSLTSISKGPISKHRHHIGGLRLQLMHLGRTHFSPRQDLSLWVSLFSSQIWNVEMTIKTIAFKLCI